MEQMRNFIGTRYGNWNKRTLSAVKTSVYTGTSTSLCARLYQALSTKVPYGKRNNTSVAGIQTGAQKGPEAQGRGGLWACHDHANRAVAYAGHHCLAYHGPYGNRISDSASWHVPDRAELWKNGSAFSHCRVNLFLYPALRW